ncbi:DUF4238 domain-containing protein [Flavobacterium anhuiense]|uniref:DUF4238 domain-containing protein n=1 Tax=Flavobacterium anhuiense TaxID=459526 RepID=UPI000E6C79B9|nr:DUF4238 domain-containing protein [Flavobacterium anhuiense]
MSQQQTSSRHHYIPKFIIKAFADSNGFVFVYDKKKNKIIDRPQSIKSIFFEKDKNSFVTENGLKSSIIEEAFYQKIDDLAAKYIRSFQYDTITTELLSNENTAQLDFFLLNLFWRVPATDFAVKDLMLRAEIKSEGISSEDVRNDEFWNKISRSRLYAESIEQLRTITNNPKYNYSKISEFDEDIFVIGDNPVLYKNIPSKFTDLVLEDYYFAVSSKRIFSSSQQPLSSFTKEMALVYNVIIIDQSKRYIVSKNIKALKDAIDIYKKATQDSLIFPLKEKLFRTAE